MRVVGGEGRYEFLGIIHFYCVIVHKALVDFNGDTTTILLHHDTLKEGNYYAALTAPKFLFIVTYHYVQSVWIILMVSGIELNLKYQWSALQPISRSKKINKNNFTVKTD